MNNPAIVSRSESGLQGLIRAMQQIPFPSNFSWDTVILVKVKNSDALCFEIIISNGKVQIEQGRPLEPNHIIEEREDEIVRHFSLVDSFSTILLKRPDGTLAGMNYSTEYAIIRGISRKYLQKDSRDLLTGIVEKDKENRSLSVSGLQIDQAPINPGRCPICNQSLSEDEVAKTIDVYTYRLTSRSELVSSTAKRIWERYHEFEAHPFQICKKCKEREDRGWSQIFGSGCSAITLFCILAIIQAIWPHAPNIVSYPIVTFMIVALTILVWAFIKNGPIPIEKRLPKIALSHRKQEHPDAGVFTENQLKELIKNHKLRNF
jgi:hypothetical protein